MWVSYLTEEGLIQSLPTIVVKDANKNGGNEKRPSPDVRHCDERRSDVEPVHDTSSEVIRQTTVDTFKIFTESIQKPPARDSAMKSV